MNQKLTKILFLFIVFLIFGCSSDDDNNSNQTFLQLNNGSVWVLNGDGYWRLNNNLNNPISYYEIDDTEACYNILNTYIEEVESIEVIENSSSSLVIELQDSGDIGTFNLSVIDNGETLKVVILGNIYTPETLFLPKTNINVNSLLICN